MQIDVDKTKIYNTFWGITINDGLSKNNWNATRSNIIHQSIFAHCDIMSHPIRLVHKNYHYQSEVMILTPFEQSGEGDDVTNNWNK